MSLTMAASPPDDGNNHPNGDNVDVNVDDSVARPPTPRRRQRDVNDDAHAVVWWKSTPIPSFPALDPRLPLHSQLPLNTFSLANTPVAQDTSAHTHALAVEALLGGPDIMAARVGTCANASILAAQLLRIRESWTSDVCDVSSRPPHQDAVARPPHLLGDNTRLDSPPPPQQRQRDDVDGAASPLPFRHE
ncbi:hypothetical protein EV363DRAFT_1456448 [Boletus edulis]|nr:hypothetical protein EV363DRAFT_1456448 [Boletus edulis]